MTTLKFPMTDVLLLIKHSVAAPAHRAAYGLGEPERGLMLVKDSGIYLMSTGVPGLTIDENRQQVVYAKGYNPNDVGCYEKARAAVGGDDFVMVLPLSDRFIKDAITIDTRFFYVGVKATEIKYWAK